MLLKMYNLFRLENQTVTRASLIKYILITYVVGIGIRLLMLLTLVDDTAMWQSNGVPVPILSPDTGLYGYYALEVLNGHISFYNIIKPDMLPAYLLAFFTYILPLDMDWVIFFLPIFIAPLIVIPMILIGNTLGNVKLGVFAALFAVVDIHYYVRTHLTYFDTDMLNLFLPLMIIWGMLKLTLENKPLYILYVSLLFWLFGVWYHSATTIIIALIVGFLVATILFFRKQILNYQAVFIFALVLLPFSAWLTLALVFISFLILFSISQKIILSEKPYLIIFTLGIVALFFIDYTHYFQRAMSYFDRPHMLAVEGKETSYYFLNQLTMVAEVVKQNIFEPSGFFNRQSSLSIIGAIGFVLMLVMYRGIFFLFPLFILGLGSYMLGARFTMYATPAMAFGLSYLIFILFENWKRTTEYTSWNFSLLRSITMIIMLSYMANIIYIASKNFHIIFKGNEITSLRTFSQELDKNDTIITWWDYGWPLWYYTGYKNTVADNGTHGEADSYMISRILMSTSPKFTANASIYLKQMQKEAHKHGERYALNYLVKKGVDINQTLESLKQGLPEMSKSKDSVYILLHSSMYNMLTSIDKSSNFDITTGKSYGKKLLLSDILDDDYNISSPFSKGELFTLDNTNGTALGANNTIIPLHNIALSVEHKAIVLRHYDSPDAKLSVLIAKGDYVIYMDNELFQSFYVQAYLLDQYDKSRFEKVVETEYMKIFKVLNPPQINRTYDE
jgi:hypothetical protein